MMASKRFRRRFADQWHELNFDGGAFLREVGLTTPAGERDRSPLEILWSRPTCEVNGIVGGYTGEGTKTVLPAKASAKITFRLVGKQNPERILEAFRAFVTSRLPPDVKAEFLGHGGSPAISLPIKNQVLRIARRALEAEWEKPAALVGSGGSIPIVGSFKRELNMDSLLVGFALDDDRVHSPNEKYDRASFHKGRALLGAHPGGARRVSEGGPRSCGPGSNCAGRRCGRREEAIADAHGRPTAASSIAMRSSAR